MTPLVYNEWETIGLILQGKYSLSRYGDGEFKLCHGKAQVSQPPSVEIRDRLRSILKDGAPNLLVGIPNVWHTEMCLLTEQKQMFWKRYQGKYVLNLLNPKKRYASSFVTRIDSAPWIACVDYAAKWKEVWSGRRVVLVQGRGNWNKAGPLDCVAVLETIIAPERDAFGEYAKLLGCVKDCVRSFRADLVILSLGPTATVLAADLCVAGIQALDMGRFGMLYSRFAREINERSKRVP